MAYSNASPRMAMGDEATEAKRRELAVKPSASFSDLPAELLVKILFEQVSPQRRLRSLRLVCRAVDDVVKHNVVEHIHLKVPGDIHKIEAMTSQPNTFHTSTRSLCLDGSQVVEEGDSWNAVVALLQKLEAIRTLQWIAPGRISEQLLGAIGELSMLETLRLTFLSQPPSATLQLLGSLLPRLKSVALNFACFRKGNNSLSEDTAAIVNTEDALCDLIVKGTALERLEVGPLAIVQPMNLERIADAIEEGAKICFSLRTIVASAMTLPILPQSTGFLRGLASLAIPNTREADQAVWPALQKSLVKLKTIKVDFPSPRLIDYIRNYHGLQSFHLGGLNSDFRSKNSGTGSADALVNRLLSVALPEHRTTIIDVRFLAAEDPSGARPGWQESLLCVNTDILRPLHRFRNLERLDLLYSVVKVHLKGGTTMHYILNTLTALSTKVRAVWFHLIGLEKVQISQNYSAHLQSELKLVQQFRFALRPSNWRDLRVVFELFKPYQFPVLGAPLPLNRVAYQVVCDIAEAKYRLKMDLEMTEILNEGKFLDSDNSIL